MMQVTPPERSPVAELTADLVALAQLGRAANVEDLAAVQSWMDEGDTADEMRAGIEIKCGQLNGKLISGLAYFNGAMRDRREAKRRAAAAPKEAAAAGKPAPQAPPAPLSAADQALLDRLRALNQPFAPLPDDFKDAKTAPLAQRWLDAGESWVRAGRPPRGKPPDFSNARIASKVFLEDMAAIEDELTAPDVPEAPD